MSVFCDKLRWKQNLLKKEKEKERERENGQDRNRLVMERMEDRLGHKRCS